MIFRFRTQAQRSMNATIHGDSLFFAALLAGVLAAAGRAGDIDSLSPSDRQAYTKAAAAAGHDPAAHVRLALWCEAHDCSAERAKHLPLAVKCDSSNALARGLLGLLEYQQQWGRPDEVAQQIRDDPARIALISEYNERRSDTPAKVDALLKLAEWCAERGLKEQSVFHFNHVLALDPSREIAWRHLGYKKQGKGWVKPEHLAVAKHNSALQKQADRSWKTKLEKMREWLLSKDSAKRAKVEEELAAVTDPRAVPMIWTIFVRGGVRLQNAAVQMLSQIDGPVGVERIGGAGGIQPHAGGKVSRTRGAQTPRSARLCRRADRHAAQAFSVRGSSGATRIRRESCSFKASGLPVAFFTTTRLILS